MLRSRKRGYEETGRRNLPLVIWRRTKPEVQEGREGGWEVHGGDKRL